MNPETLTRAIQTLQRLDRAGSLEDFLEDVARATRGPQRDLDRWPTYRYEIARFSRLAVRLFGVPTHVAVKAATEALLPATRERLTLQILDEHEERLDTAAAQEAARRQVRSFNRRVGA